MPRAKSEREFEALLILIPKEWKLIIRREAARRDTNITEIMRPHIKRIVEAMELVNEQAA